LKRGINFRLNLKIEFNGIISKLEQLSYIGIMSQNSYRIVNIVANTDVHIKLNLTNIAHSSKGHKYEYEYEPELYRALIFRIINPKLSILVNTSGKIIFTGAKKFKDIEKARNILFKRLCLFGYSPVQDKIYVQNIVVVTQFKLKNGLNRIWTNCVENQINSYRNQHRIVIKINNPRFTAILFHSGKCLMAGFKNEDSIKIGLSILNNLFK